MPQIMEDMDIAFPNLGIYLHNVPKTIMIGNFGIAIYGVLIALPLKLHKNQGRIRISTGTLSSGSLFPRSQAHAFIM